MTEAQQPSETPDAIPTVREGDWIRTTYGKWAKVHRVFESGSIECLIVGSRDDAYRREFIFRDGWWRFRYPSPNGGYLPHEQRKRTAAMLTEGPPFRILGVAGPLEYLETGQRVCLPPHNLPPDTIL